MVGRSRRSAFAALVLAGAFAGAQAPVAAAEARAVPGELIVGWEAGVTQRARTAALAREGAAERKRFGPIRAALVSLAPRDTAAALRRLRADPRVRYVEANSLVFAADLPDDPLFGDLWALENTGQTVNGVAGMPDADVDGRAAWSVTRGAGTWSSPSSTPESTSATPTSRPTRGSTPGRTARAAVRTA